MHHEQFHSDEVYEKASVDAVWPASVAVAPLPILDIEHCVHCHDGAVAPQRHAPVGVGTAILASYTTLVGALGLATLGSRIVEAILP